MDKLIQEYSLNFNDKYLELDWNKVNKLDGIEKFTQLRGLSLEYNAINDISKLQTLTTLKYLKLYGNSLT